MSIHKQSIRCRHLFACVVSSGYTVDACVLLRTNTLVKIVDYMCIHFGVTLILSCMMMMMMIWEEATGGRLSPL